MKTFKHYILTRFNLGIYDENNAYAEIVKDPDEWLKHRIEIFEQTALPSIFKQTCKNFKWVLAFDDRTPPDIIKRYDYCENVEICYCQPHLHIREKEPESKWLITTRFDNDDILFAEFVETIQNEFKEVDEVIDIEYQKVRYLKTKDTFASFRSRPNSPFLSFVEPWNNSTPLTAMGKKHTVFPDFYPARKLPLVLAYQVIHDRNVINKI